MINDCNFYRFCYSDLWRSELEPEGGDTGLIFFELCMVDWILFGENASRLPLIVFTETCLCFITAYGLRRHSIQLNFLDYRQFEHHTGFYIRQCWNYRTMNVQFIFNTIIQLSFIFILKDFVTQLKFRLNALYIALYLYILHSSTYYYYFLIPKHFQISYILFSKQWPLRNFIL